MDTKGSVAAKPITENTLFSGDNLDNLREDIDTESADLLYLSPTLLPMTELHSGYRALLLLRGEVTHE